MEERSHGVRWMWPIGRVMLAVCAAGLLLIPTAGSASAHSALEASDPPAGAVLATQPVAVTLTFNEPVELSDGAIEVFDDRFKRVDTGRVTSVGAERTRIRAALRPALAQGTYTVSWHASSADTHPVSGSFQFSVGRPSVVTGTVPGTGRNDLAGLMLGGLRWAGYVGLLLGPGMLLVALALWPAGLTDRRTRRLMFGGLSLLAISTLGAMLLQGVWASGEPFSALWTAPEELDTHSRRFDKVYAGRSFLLLGFAAALVVALSMSVRVRTRPSRLLLVFASASSLALLVTWPLVGHPSVGDGSALAIAVNVVHTLAMTLWLGGLVLVLVCLRPMQRAVELAVVLPRFSRLALVAVVTLVTTGTFMAWREVGSLTALTTTAYGRVLLAKLLGVVALVVLGNLARLWVKRHLSGGIRGNAVLNPPLGDSGVAAGQVAVLVRGLVAETMIAFGVLAVTAALVVIVPAR